MVALLRHATGVDCRTVPPGKAMDNNHPCRLLNHVLSTVAILVIAAEMLDSLSDEELLAWRCWKERTPETTIPPNNTAKTASSTCKPTAEVLNIATPSGGL
jgi:hypothetical protein